MWCGPVIPILAANGLQGSLFAGYGRYFGWFYIAGEILANYTAENEFFLGAVYNDAISLRTSWGAKASCQALN